MKNAIPERLASDFYSVGEYRQQKTAQKFDEYGRHCSEVLERRLFLASSVEYSTMNP